MAVSLAVHEGKTCRMSNGDVRVRLSRLVCRPDPAMRGRQGIGIGDSPKCHGVWRDPGAPGERIDRAGLAGRGIS